MGKLKTHKGLKKVLNIRQSGSITKQKGGALHNTGKKNHVQSKRAGSKDALNHSDYKRFKNVI